MTKSRKSAGSKKTVTKAKSVVIQLPESDLIQAAKLEPKALEGIVRNILGGQHGRGIDQVILKGGRASGPSAAPIGWTKTLWTRNC